jgi:uncharacterized membrane protein YcaP (DUF421 family)
MDAVLRAAVVYLILLVLFRLIGKRSLAQITTFDVVLLLIISEAIQQALLDGDDSMTNAFLIVVTLLGIEVALSLVTIRSQLLDKLIDDVPLVLIEDGKLHHWRMKKARVSEDDILEQARHWRAVERLDQVKYAILERSGGISVIPYPGSGDRPPATGAS